ncbi:hypothetical protein [Clostridium sp.]|uniref:hypothetical protein n=1 Tax=Clostridium sp. TaxID=1506 RepID=UPI002FCAECF9
MSKIKAVTISNLHEVDLEELSKRIAREQACILAEKLSPRQLDILIEKLKEAN